MYLGNIGNPPDGFWLGASGSDPFPVEALTVSNNFASYSSAHTSTAFVGGVWHHGCAVFASATSRTAYNNGGGAATDTVSITPIATTLGIAIGAIVTGSPIGYYVGDMAECGIWDVALTPDEVASLARGVSALSIRPQNLVGYWPIIGKSSPEIDLVGGVGATLVNGPITAPHCRIFYPATGAAIAYHPVAVPTIEPPPLSIAVALHAPEVFAPISLEVPAQSITVAAPVPAILADFGFQVPVLNVSVVARTPDSVNFEEEVIVEDERALEPANFKVRIVDYVGGDDLRISRTYTELPGGIAVSKGYLTIKRLATSADADAIIQKQITASEGIAGQITDDTTTGGSIALHFDLTGAETGMMTPLVPYHYDVQIISQAGAIYTCEKGVMVMQQGVTDATS